MVKIDITAPGVKAEGPLLQDFRREVAELLERKSLGFPGAQPVSFARRHIEELTKQDYYVCEKSDGLRYLLYCTADTDGKELHYLIDRKNDYWYVPDLHFPLPDNEIAFHTNTIIDGELVIDKDPHQQIQAKYLVFDCLVLDGNSLMTRTLDKRIAYFKERVFDPYTTLLKKYPEEIQFLPFMLELKQMQFGYGLEMMFRNVLPNLPHGNDGLIFTCRNTDYKFGTDPHILKWKPESENSVDFHLSLEFPIIQPDVQDIDEGVTEPYFDYDAMPTANLLAYMGDHEEDRPYGKLHLEPEEWEKMRALNEPLDDRIAECYMDAQKRWRFMRWREDKQNANHISTVESVIESITDRVTEKELIASSKRIRDEWKRRAAREQEEDKKRRAARDQEEERKRRQGHGENSQASGANGTVLGTKRKAEDQGGARPSPGPPQGGKDS